VTVTDRRDSTRPGVADVSIASPPRGFRPGSRRRTRIAAGVVLAAVAIGGNVLLYTSLDDTTDVLQIVRPIRAGQVVTSDDVRVVGVDLDPTVPTVRADDIGSVVGQYARVHLASGSLLAPQFVQSSPLVAPGSGVVAVEISPTLTPSGLRERSRVMIVVVGGIADGSDFVTTGRVVARGADADQLSGRSSLSVEVAEVDAPVVAAGDDVRVVLIDPATDPAMQDDTAG
jgi:hypothetical protein